MTILGFIVLCVIVGLFVWLINAYLPIPHQIKSLIVVASVIVLMLGTVAIDGYLWWQHGCSNTPDTVGSRVSPASERDQTTMVYMVARCWNILGSL